MDRAEYLRNLRANRAQRGTTEYSRENRSNRHLRAKILRLYKLGFSENAIADGAGVGQTTVGYLIHGRVKTNKWDTYELLTKLTMEDIFERAPDTAYFPLYPSQRRLQALYALGYRREDISVELEAIGESPFIATNILRSPRTTARSHRAIATVYDKLSASPGPSETQRKRAIGRGFAPPMAWDNIDDYYEKPKGVLHEV